MIDILKIKKLNKTPFRKKVLAIFYKHNNAIPLSIIEDGLKSYNRITLYRTIKLFVQAGVIHEITISGEESNYAICQEGCDSINHQHQHIHFKCKGCEIIYCVELDKFPIISLPNYKIEQLEIQAIGLCGNCNILSSDV